MPWPANDSKNPSARCQRYIEAGAEAITDSEQYKKFTSSLAVPVLANMTEFGKSPLMSVDQLKDVGVHMVLYPLSAFRAMNQAAEYVYHTIRCKPAEFLHYLHYEKTMDRLPRQGPTMNPQVIFWANLLAAFLSLVFAYLLASSTFAALPFLTFSSWRFGMLHSETEAVPS